MPTDEQAIETPATDTTSAPPATPDESSSLADHEARYKDGGRSQPEAVEASTEAATPPADQPETEPAKDESETDEYGPRDETGKFLPRKRHRAQSQEATPADVPRIRELTARLRAAEAERDAYKARAGGDGLTPATAARPAPPPPIPAPTPKPTPDKFDDYSAYVEALTDWKTDQKLAAAEQQRAQAEQQRQAEAARQRITDSWNAKRAAAEAKYHDFKAVAIDTDTFIRPGSLIDAWILDPDNETGAELLYYLQQHPDEVARIDKLPTLKQAESLALLSQRFNGHGRPPAAATGSAAPSSTTPPPKPPNPVRTGPVRAGDEPPDPEKSSLADHEKWYAARPRRGGGSARA